MISESEAMKRIVLTDKFGNDISITKSLQNNCYVNHRKVDNIGIYELVETYKYAGFKISAYRMGQVYYWGSVCDMNNLLSFKTIFELKD